MSTALLLIDELGFEPMTRPEASLFFRLVTYRYGRGAILITTNKSVRDWTECTARGFLDTRYYYAAARIGASAANHSRLV